MCFRLCSVFISLPFLTPLFQPKVNPVSGSRRFEMSVLRESSCQSSPFYTDVYFQLHRHSSVFVFRKHNRLPFSTRFTQKRHIRVRLFSSLLKLFEIMICTKGCDVFCPIRIKVKLVKLNTFFAQCQHNFF